MIFGNAAHAKKDLFLYLQAGTFDFQVTTATKSAAVSGLGAYSFGLGYAFSSQWLATVSLDFLRSGTLTGDAAVGVDAGVRWYPWTYSGYKYLEDSQIQYEITQLWRPYVGFAVRQRQFILAITTTYLGAGIFIGTDYQLNRKMHLNFELRHDQYQGSDEETSATMMNILFGAAYHF